MALELTKDNFETEVLKSDMPVLVDFWAPWCGPCQMLGPVVEELAGEVTTAKVAKLNVDDYPELAQQYGVLSIPSIKVWKNGEIVKELVGVQSKEVLKEALGL